MGVSSDGSVEASTQERFEFAMRDPAVLDVVPPS